MTATISGNNVSQTKGAGILMVARDVTGSGTVGGSVTTGLRVTIQNNTVGAPSGVEDGIRVDSGNGSAGSNPAVCLSISNNTSTGSTGLFGIGLRKEGSSATTNFFGIVGLTPSPATNSQMVTYVQGQNPGTTAEAISSVSNNFVSCTLP
jgi:hypothetical protein